MRVIVLADTHFGVRLNSGIFHDNMEKFYKNTFFPFLDQNPDIKGIIHVGDVFDDRKRIEMYTAWRARKYFFDPLQEREITMIVTAGNHDLALRHSSEITALREILSQYSNIKFVTEVTDLNIGYTKLCLVPWIHNENRERSLEAIKKSNAQIVFGHLELTGYQMYKGQISKHGEDPALFEKFEHAYSGHFHHKNSRNNITYLGSVSQHIWTDWGDVRGFHVFDTKTHEMEFVANPYDMFKVISYTEDMQFDPDYYKGMYVRLTHGEIQSQTKFNNFVKNLNEAGVANLQIIPLSQSHQTGQIEDSSNVEDTTHIIQNYIQDDPPVVDKMLDLLTRAQLCT